MRRFFCDGTLPGLRDYYLDGLCLGAARTIIETSAVYFLEQLAVEVCAAESQLGRHPILIAASDLKQPPSSTATGEPSNLGDPAPAEERLEGTAGGHPTP